MPGLREGRHSWNPADHPRDGDGQFARTAGGGSSHAPDSPSGGRHRTSRGMPDTLTSGSVALSKGGTGTIGRHANGDVSIGDGTSSKRMSSEQATKLLNTLAVADDWDAGEDEHLPGVGTVTRTKGGVRADLDDGPSLDLTQRDVTRLERERERADQATRVDTGNGDLDVFPDGKKIAFRHLGDDGKPAEVSFNRASMSKISRTIDQFIDDIDDADTPTKPSYSKTVTTNIGKVNVELTGNWGKPGSTLTITPEDGDDWGMAVDGPHQHDWSRAVSDLLDETARTTPHNLSESVPLTEAAGGSTPKGRRFRARIIAGDIQGSSGYYPAEMLKRDAAVFREGLPVFLDHPGATESYDRPERSVRDLAGKLASTAVYERDGLYADVEVYPHWAPVVEAMAGDIGMSIRASGTVEPSQQEGIRGPIVTSLTEAASVDFVTAAGAGGKVVALLESARAHSGDLLRKAVEAARPAPDGTPEDEPESPDVPHDQDDEDEPAKKTTAAREAAAHDVPAPPVTTLKEGAPVSGGTNQGTPNGGPIELSEAELRTSLAETKQKLAEAELEIAKLGDQSRQLAEAKTALAEAERTNLRLIANNTARDKAVETLAESTLPEVAHAKVIESVTGANVPLNEDGALDEAKLVTNIKAAIEAERAYLTRFAEAAGIGRVRGLGDTDQHGLSEAAFNAGLKDVFTTLGLPDDVADLAVKGR